SRDIYLCVYQFPSFLDLIPFSFVPILPQPPRTTLFPYTTLFRSSNSRVFHTTKCNVWFVIDSPIVNMNHTSVHLFCKFGATFYITCMNSSTQTICCIIRD